MTEEEIEQYTKNINNLKEVMISITESMEDSAKNMRGII